MTSAWIVTSSAVVGSSARISRGLPAERRGDHHPLQHAAGQLVGEAAHQPRRVVELDVRQQPGGAGDRRLPTAAGVDHRLGDEVADRPDRVDVRPRVLEDHRDLVAPEAPKLGPVQPENIDVAEANRPGRVGIGREQARRPPARSSTCLSPTRRPARPTPRRRCVKVTSRSSSRLAPVGAAGARRGADRC